MAPPLWVVAAVLGALAQTGRNALQAHLTTALGTAGATQVRFLFGLPVALLFLAGHAALTGQRPPSLTLPAMGWTAMGALAQIGGTALMLVLMRRRSFAISTAWLKTEPVLVALLGVVVLGDGVTTGMMAAIALAVAGVLILSVKPDDRLGRFLDAGPALLGLLAGLGFGLAAIGFRGGITALPTGSALSRTLLTLVLSLTIQTTVLLAWLALRDRKALVGSFQVWRSSLMAGALGAFASACWFTGFSLTSAANVRTVALIEVPFALLASRLIFGQRTSGRQMLGMAVILGGVGALLNLQL